MNKNEKWFESKINNALNKAKNGLNYILS